MIFSSVLRKDWKKSFKSGSMQIISLKNHIFLIKFKVFLIISLQYYAKMFNGILFRYKKYKVYMLCVP